MKKFSGLVIVLSFALVSTGCISMRSSEREQLRELRDLDISHTRETIKHPGLAGALNMLPGFGNFYLAAGTDQSEQWVAGFLNLLFWPISPVWGIPEAAIDAITINKLETLHYYYHTPAGLAELESKRAEQGIGDPPLTPPPPAPDPERLPAPEPPASSGAAP